MLRRRFAIVRGRTDLQKVLGDEFTQFALWNDPFFPVYLKEAMQDQDICGRPRLLAEDSAIRCIMLWLPEPIPQP